MRFSILLTALAFLRRMFSLWQPQDRPQALSLRL